MAEAIDLRRQRFGRFIVLDMPRQLVRNASGRAVPHWSVLCDCGTVVLVRGDHLRSGRSRSCGCLNSDVVRARNEVGKHGMARTDQRHPLYNTWLGMVQRCCNPASKDFKRYGERGVQVCARWRDSFEAFLEDMGPKPSPKHQIDREDNDGIYEPGNCR